MRIKNKELRQRRNRKARHVKSVIKELKAQALAAKGAPVEKPAPKPKAPAKPKAETAAKPAAEKPAAEKPAAKKAAPKAKKPAKTEE